MNLNLVEYKTITQLNNLPEGRHYQTENGDRYPSITNVLSNIGKDGIEKWRKEIGEEEADRICSKSSDVGNDLHSMCEEFLYGNIIHFANYSKRSKQLFNQINPALNKIDNVKGIELPMWSDDLKVAGTSDCIADYDGVPSIIDFKNSRKPKKKEWISNYFQQGAAYSKMFHELYGELPKQIVIIVGVWNGELQIFKEKVKDHFPDLLDTMKKYNPLWEKS